MIKTHYLANPFYLYIFVFSIALYLFGLHWSNLYSTLTVPLIIFFILTFEISLLFGWIYDKNFNTNNIISPVKRKKIDILYIVIIVCISIEFIYNKGIPLFLFSNANLDYNYKDFGIKTFHVVVFTLTSFYTIYLFQVYLSTKKYIDFFKFLSLYIYPILIMNRGSLLMVTTSIIYIYFILKKRIYFKTLLKIFLGVIFLLYLFGVLGNIRQNDNSYLMKLAQPSEEYLNLHIPSAFIWSYIYISSPIATLELNIDQKSNNSLEEFLLSSIIPDFISKHFSDYQFKINQLTNWLTVGSMYSRAYKSFGWIGMWILFLFITILVLIYRSLLSKQNSYSLTGYSILLTMITFSIFDNMWTFSGLSLQLIYPFILMRFQRIKLR